MRRSLAALAVAGLLAACASAPAADDPRVLRVVMADDWASAPLFGEVVDGFERDNPGVRVQVQASPFSQIPDLVTSSIELGQPYDLAHWHAFAAAADGFAEPIGDLWDEAGLDPDDYLPGAIEDVSWDGRLHGVPLDVNALVLMANREQLDDIGLAPENLGTPADFRSSAAALRAGTDADHAIAVTASSWATYGWITAGGGQLIDGIDDDGDPVFTFDDPATIAVLEMLVDLVASGDAPPPFAPDLSLDAVAAFASGETALHASGSWDLPITRRALQAGPEIGEVVVLPLPQADPASPRTVLGGSSLFVPEGAANRELAFALMLALTEDDVALELASQEGRLPAREEVYDDPLFAASDDLAAFVEQLPDARVMPLIAYPEVSAAFRDGLEATLAQRLSAEDAMLDVQEAAERWLEER